MELAQLGMEAKPKKRRTMIKCCIESKRRWQVRRHTRLYPQQHLLLEAVGHTANWTKWFSNTRPSRWRSKAG